MTARQQAHFELQDALGFPDWCGSNWDAFNDCFGTSWRKTTEPSSRSCGDRLPRSDPNKVTRVPAYVGRDVIPVWPATGRSLPSFLIPP
jgi:hypothetical protein